MRLLAVGGGRQFLFFASPLDVLRIFSPLTPAILRDSLAEYAIFAERERSQYFPSLPPATQG